MDKNVHRKQKHRKIIYEPPNAGQITDMADLHGIKITDNLCNYDWRSPGTTNPVQIERMASWSTFIFKSENTISVSLLNFTFI